METQDFYCDFVLNNKIEVKREAETDSVLAFYVVIIPKQHVRRLADLGNFSVISEIFEIAQKIILKYKLHESNYKIITNGGDFQDSQHLHFHLVSGKPTMDFKE